MGGAGPRSRADEASVPAADRKLRRPPASGAGSRHGGTVWSFVHGAAPGPGPGVRFSRRAAAVSLLGNSGGHAARPASRLLALAGSGGRGPLHSHSDLCVWRGADWGWLRPGFLLPAEAGILWPASGSGNAAGALAQGVGA